MKLIILLAFIVAITISQSEALKKCIQDRCPDQYKKCKATSGCEAKLQKCAKKCGQIVDQTCWTFCLGLPGAAANVAICAVDKKCLSGISKMDRAGLNLMQAIETIETMMN